MTAIIHKALTGALALYVLSACAKEESEARAAASHDDAGALRDAGAPLAPNLRADAAQDGEARNADAASGRAAQVEAGRSASGAGGASGSGGHAGADITPDAGPATSEPDNDAGASEPSILCAACGGCEETIQVVSTMHTNNPVTYPDPPPTSGPHNPCWGRWGIHDEPLRAERWVHNLEHGGVVFLYNCPDGCDAEINALKKIVSDRYRTILTAYADLPTRFGVVSWGHRLTSECFDEQAYVAFYNQNFDHAPESNANPPNPSCPP